jgi:hypothetical protein
VVGVCVPLCSLAYIVTLKKKIFLDHRASAGWQVDDYLGRLEAARAPARPMEGSAE